jgi:hypothetical protein
LRGWIEALAAAKPPNATAGLGEQNAMITKHVSALHIFCTPLYRESQLKIQRNKPLRFFELHEKKII